MLIRSSSSLFLSLFLASFAAFVVIDAAPAMAEEVEPVDKNFSGALVGGNIYFGQAISVGDSSPGIAFLSSVEAGWGFARDTWKRTELTFELGAGNLQFKKQSADKATVNVPVSFYGLAKAGFGYSIGSHAFAVMRLGAGPAFSKISQKANGVTETADSTAAGYAFTVGMDLVAPATDNFYFVGGAHLRRMSFTSEIGPNSDVYQINIPLVNLGVRYRF